MTLPVDMRESRGFARLCRAAVFAAGFLLGATLGSVQAGEAPETPPVFFVQLDESSAQIFDRWPPGALDYAVLMHHVGALEPALVVMADVVFWPDFPPPHQRILTSKLASIDVVWGAVLDANPVERAPPEVWETWMKLREPEGRWPDLARCPGVTAMPDPSLRAMGKIGFIQLDFGPRIEVSEEAFEMPVLARAGQKHLVAALPLAALIRVRGWDGKALETDGETGAVSGPGGFHLPLDGRGMLRVPLSLRARLQKLSAAALLPAMANGPGEATIPKGALIVIGGDASDRRVLTLADGTAISRAEVMALATLALVSESWMEPKRAATEVESEDGEDVERDADSPTVVETAEADDPWLGIPDDVWLWMAGIASCFFLWWGARLHGGRDRREIDPGDEGGGK